MVVILHFFAFLEFIGGVGVFAGSKSAIHEILGTLAIGFSIMTVGLAAILTEAQRSRKVLEKHGLPRASANTQESRKVLEKQPLPPEPANTQIDLPTRAQPHQQVPDFYAQRLKAIFATARGHIVLLQDGRVLSIVGANFEFVRSMGEYRRAYQDHSQWQELTTPHEKQRFWNQVAPVVRKIFENHRGD